MLSPLVCHLVCLWSVASSQSRHGPKAPHRVSAISCDAHSQAPSCHTHTGQASLFPALSFFTGVTEAVCSGGFFGKDLLIISASRLLLGGDNTLAVLLMDVFSFLDCVGQHQITSTQRHPLWWWTQPPGPQHINTTAALICSVEVNCNILQNKVTMSGLKNSVCHAHPSGDCLTTNRIFKLTQLKRLFLNVPLIFSFYS